MQNDTKGLCDVCGTVHAPPACRLVVTGSGTDPVEPWPPPQETIHRDVGRSGCPSNLPHGKNFDCYWHEECAKEYSEHEARGYARAIADVCAWLERDAPLGTHPAETLAAHILSGEIDRRFGARKDDDNDGR